MVKLARKPQLAVISQRKTTIFKVLRRISKNRYKVDKIEKSNIVRLQKKGKILTKAALKQTQ